MYLPGRALLALLLAGTLALGVGSAQAQNEGRFAVAETLALPDARAGAPAASTLASSQARCPKTTRATKDRPDVRNGRLLHVIYLVPSDRPDQRLDTDGTLQCSMEAQNRWLKEQTGLRWRYDTYVVTRKVRRKRVRTEFVDVTFVRSGRSAAELDGAGEVSDELNLRGFNHADKRYLTFAASGSDGGPCGDAFWPFASQDPNADGQYAQVYLLSSEGCHADEFGVPGAPSFAEMIAQQEVMHNDGMVPIGAPHGCGPISLPAHVCTGPLAFVDGLDPERFDVLYPFVSVPLSQKKVDIDNNDYFRHPFPYRDLDQSPYLEPAR